MSTGEILWALTKLLLACIPLVISLGALLDAARRPEWAFSFAGKSRTLWVALNGAGILFCVVGVVVSLWYWAKVRPVVAGVEQGRLDP